MTLDQDRVARETLLTKDIQAALHEETAEINPNDGLERFMAGVEANPKAPAEAPWWQRLNGWLGDIGFSPALASVVVMVQVGVIAALLASHAPPDRAEAPENTYRGARGPAQEKPDLKVTINPDADFASLVTLLRANNCRIIAGPSELGELWVVVADKKNIVEIRRMLEQSRLVDDVVANL